jgi:hypothetical protein
MSTRFLGRRRRGLARLIRHRGIRFRPGRSLRRQLSAMEDALTAEAPKLASMFEVFNLLTRHERPLGIEPLASPAPVPGNSLMSRGPRGSAGPAGPRRLAAIAALVALAVVAVTCLAITTQIRPSARSCLVATPAGFSDSASRVPGCLPYPLQK